MHLDTSRRSDPERSVHELPRVRRLAWRQVARFGAASLLGAIAFAPTATAQQPDSTATDSVRQGPACTACIQGPRPGLSLTTAGLAADTTRRKAIEYSDAYGTRLAIHRIGSYAELPLFAAEYLLGQKLLNDTTTFNAPGSGQRGIQSSTRSWHNNVAAGLGVLFASNTITGVWNLIESRHDPAGRTRRWIHSLTMLAADAGFAMTASTGGAARRTLTGANNHRNLALGSLGLATVSTLMMWLWKD